MTDYNLTNIRTLLTAAFTDEEFDQFCYDQFRPVYESFSGGMSRTKKIHGLIEYCDRKLLMDKLLGLIQQTQPDRYKKHQPYGGATLPPAPPADFQPSPPALSKPPQTPKKAFELFFSYAHKDEGLRDELATHLKMLQRQGVITTWHDRQITAGSEWAGAIDTHLNSAGIILLLISPDFIASDYCYDIELTRAMERHEAGEAIVIPVILRPADWTDAPFGKLQALPKNAHPVTLWPNRDEAWLNVAQGIRKAAGQLAANP
jgi:hypothetical protein